MANGLVAVDGRPGRRHVLARRPGRARPAGRRRRRTATPTTTPRPTTTSVVDRPDVGRRRRARGRPAAGPARASTRTLHVARAAGRRRRHGSASAGRRDAPRSSCRPASDFVRVTHHLRQPRPRPPPAGLVPAARAGRPSRGPSAPSPSSSGASTAEGGPTEHGLPTFPSRRFVSAGGLTVVHEGLLEYELVDGRPAPLALTLLRCHRACCPGAAMTYRPLPAGPAARRSRARRCTGRVTRALRACRSATRDPYALVDDAFLPLLVAPAPGGGDRPAAGSALDGRRRRGVGACAGWPAALEVRVFNPAAEPTTVDRRRPPGLARRPARPPARARSTAPSPSPPGASPPSTWPTDAH